jgi:hypothetical protein
MKLEVVDTLPFAPARVFMALRDNLKELALHMENIESVEVLEREERQGLLHQYNRWQGAKHTVPAAFRPFVTQPMIAWFDRAEWDEPSLCCRWRIEPVKFSNSFECSGSTTMSDADGGHCRIVFVADAQIHLERIALIPAFVARRFQEPVERFVVKQLRPNFNGIATALRSYLAAGG